MNGSELEDLRRPLGGASGAFAVGIFAFLVAALVFFTEASLTAAPIAEISVQLAVTTFCCIVVYIAMSEAGVERGERQSEVTEARAELCSHAERIRKEGRIGGLAEFCRALVLTERESRRAEILGEVGLDEAECARLRSSRELLSSESRRVRAAVRRAERVRLLRLTPELLLYGGERQRRAMLPVSAVAVRWRATLRALLPALLGSTVTVSVALAVRSGLDASAVASAVFRLLALISTAAKGYRMGYSSVVRDEVRSLGCRAAYLARYLKESA